MSKYHSWNHGDEWDTCNLCDLERINEGTKRRKFRTPLGTWGAHAQVPECKPPPPPSDGATRKRLRVERPKVNGQSKKASTAAEGKARDASLDVWKLKVHGALSFREIGEKLGIGATTAYRLFKATMEEINGECRSLGEHYREIETTRLEVQRQEVKAIHDGTDDADVALKAHATLLRIADRFAKLHGLDAPTQILIAEGIEVYWGRLMAGMKEKDPDLAARNAAYHQKMLDEAKEQP